MSILTGYGGTIKIDGKDMEIKGWTIDLQINPAGMKRWNGKAELKDKNLLLPKSFNGVGVFKKVDVTYSGNIIIKNIPINLNAKNGQSPTIMTFSGSGKLESF
jgi:hypothetical protein